MRVVTLPRQDVDTDAVPRLEPGGVSDEASQDVLAEHLGRQFAAEVVVEPGLVLEVTVENVEEAKERLVANGCQIVKDEPEFPRCYVKDPYGLIYNLTA